MRGALKPFLLLKSPSMQAVTLPHEDEEEEGASGRADALPDPQVSVQRAAQVANLITGAAARTAQRAVGVLSDGSVRRARVRQGWTARSRASARCSARPQRA